MIRNSRKAPSPVFKTLKIPAWDWPLFIFSSDIGTPSLHG